MQDFSPSMLTSRERERLLHLAKARGLRRNSITLRPIERVSRDEVLRLSFAQQRLWFLAQLDGASAAYHMAGGIRLSGDLDREALVRALERIVVRHEALRTSFAMIDGRLVQRVAHEDIGFALSECDLCGCAEREGELQRIAQEEAT